MSFIIKRTFLIPLIILFSVNLFAQDYTTRKTATGKSKKFYEKGMECVMQRNDEKAIAEFEKALKIDPSFIDAQIQWAAINYEQKLYNKAEIGFQKVLDIDPNYNTKVFYTLAITKRQLGKYDEAASVFQQYLDSGATNKTLLEKADRQAKSCLLIDDAINNPVPFEPINLGPNINAIHPDPEKQSSEYLPSLTVDGQTLVYTVRIGMNEDFYFSRKVNGEWQKGEPIIALNTAENEGAQNVSADGKMIVFTDCGGRKGYGSCDIFYSENKNGQWTPARNIRRPINSEDWESQPSLSADGSEIYFCSSRKGGFGDSDIWVSKRNDDGSWGEPKNLGDKINTPLAEQSPFIHPDGQTLYFSSRGLPGMGSADLFVVRKEEDGSWGEPKNLGFPINTKDSEGALIISLDGQTAYFATDRKYGTPGEDVTFGDAMRGSDTDIYKFELYPEVRPQPVTYVKANVFDIVTDEKLIAEVEFVDLSTGNIHVSSKTDSDGEFLVCLPMGKNYSLNVSKEKYLFHSENFSLEEINSLNEPYLLDIGLQPIPDPSATADNGLPKSKPIILKNVFFETAKADLRPESITELNRLKKLLVENPKLQIQLNGHTDNVGTDEDNLQLSDARAKAVHDYLIAGGIAENRLKYKGYGESMPIDTNDTPQGRQNNRRTEFEIIN